MIPTDVAVQNSMCLYRDDIYALSRMSFQLIVSQMLDEIHEEYKIILKANNIKHQFVSGIISEEYVLGCIDPIYRNGKPLIYMMDSRHMILAMCDKSTNSNSSYSKFPSLHVITAQDGQMIHLPVRQIELLPLGAVQSSDVHFTYRPFIEFNHVDTFGPLANRHSVSLMQQVHRPPPFIEFATAQTSSRSVPAPVGLAPPISFQSQNLNKRNGQFNVKDFIDSMFN